MRQSIRKAISMILTAAIMLPGAGTVRAAETRTEYDENADPFIRSYEEDDDLLSAAGSGDVSKINKPRTSEGVSTWDCIWFGNYWQEDTNGDGYCYAEDTNGHLADSKQPIKWRVLDIYNVDKNGDKYALLLADKLIDIVQYNETYTDVTWQNCTMRSYLNGYDGSKNVCDKDFSEKSGNRSFVYSAFNDAEINCLINGEVKNPNNPVYGTTGGNTTHDWLFCLSLEEAMNGDYGFIKNKFTNPSDEEKQWYTDDDPTRVAVTTKFTNDKPGYDSNTAGEPDWWWLRSPGYSSNNASAVNSYGAAGADYDGVYINNSCLRPAFRMNLSSSSSLWSYAGTVSSDGTVNTAVDNVKGPQTTDSGVSTWDCIWFGNYWQEDTNGDGKCYAEETPVEGTTYPADEKQPIKWRVLDIDDNGNALLLADKLIDIVQYNETDTDVTWETCTLRSYLNGYDGSKNVCNKDFSEKSGNRSFVYSAFKDAEINCLIESEVNNPDNPVYVTKGGNTTHDWLFCLSLEEAMNGDYGFIKNEFTNPSSEEIKFYTDVDPTREAVTTKFTDDKPGYYGDTAGTSAWWWLRSPGKHSHYASYVKNYGAADAGSNSVDHTFYCVRPAFRMNLSSSSSLWSYAGTVDSRGDEYMDEKKMVTGVTLSSQVLIRSGKNVQLTPEIEPGDAFNKAVTWKSSDSSIATVSENGVVTGVKGGSAYVTVTTKDRGYTASCNVIVEQSVTGVKLKVPKDEIAPGESIDLEWEVLPSDAADKTVSFNSAAPDIVSVDQNGRVTGQKEGSADITVTTNDGGYTTTCRVTVTKEGTDPGPDPSEEDLKKDIDVDAADRNFDMLPGEVRRLPINKTGKYVYGVSYVSSDPKTVSVKNGVVAAKKLKKGETEKKVTVTATYNGESVPFVITVKASLPAIEAGQKGSKITAPKTVKAGVGTSKTVTATVKLPKALQGKEVRAKVVLPEDLPGTSVADGDTENAFFDLGEGKPDAKGTKVSFVITPREAGAAYIVWTVTDDGGNRSQAYSKVLIKKPLSTLSVNCPETGLDLSVGEGERLIVTTTKGNTDSKDLSFSVKGKGVKVSKSGFVTAVTPGAEADVTVKAGKVNKKISVRVKEHPGSILALNKTSVNVKLPKKGAKPKTVALKVTIPKKNSPDVTWSITDSPKGITVDSYGIVTVTSDASPGCYTVAATPEETGNGYNPVCCELIVR